jgi:hypothetical protein
VITATEGSTCRVVSESSCSSSMSVAWDMKSSRLLTFFSLALRVTALSAYVSISLGGSGRAVSERDALVSRGRHAGVGGSEMQQWDVSGRKVNPACNCWPYNLVRSPVHHQLVVAPFAIRCLAAMDNAGADLLAMIGKITCVAATILRCPAQPHLMLEATQHFLHIAVLQMPVPLGPALHVQSVCMQMYLSSCSN